MADVHGKMREETMGLNAAAVIVSLFYKSGSLFATLHP